MRPLLQRLALLCGSLLLAGFVGEMALRLVGSAPSEDPQETSDAPKGVMRREQRTGWIPREGTERRKVDAQGQPFVLRVNSTGQRGPELKVRHPRQRRLLFLGDSFTMASQTREQDTFAARTDSLLNAAAPVEVVNGGVEGYSTYQELAYYRYYGRALEPDIVVLCFFAGNDFRDNMVHTRQGQLLSPALLARPEKFRDRHRDPYLRNAEGELLYDPLQPLTLPQPHGAIATWLNRNLLLARLLHSRSFRLWGRLSGNLNALDFDARYVFYQVGLFQGRNDGLLGTSRELALDCLAQLHRLVKADGAELLVVYLPSLIQLDDDHLRQYLARYSVDPKNLGTLDPAYTTRLVRDFCGARQLPFLDLSPPFLAAENTADLYLTAIGDGHFSAAGHQLAAQHIARFVQQQSIHFGDAAAELYRRARQHRRQHQAGPAEAALQEATRRQAGWAAPHVQLGHLYHSQKKWNRALESYRTALEIDPKNSAALAGTAASLANLNNGKEAIAAYRRALDVHPGWWPFWEALHELYAGENMVEERRETQQHLEEVYNAPNYIRDFWWVEHVSQGALYTAHGQQDAAAREYARALHFLPAETDDPETLYNLGIVLKQRDKTEALASFKKAFSLQPDLVQAGMEVALIYEEQGNVQAAAQILQEIVEQDLRWPDAWVNLGFVHARMGAFDAARRAWKKALALSPDHPQARANLEELDRINK